jgi:hypothetical protein
MVSICCSWRSLAEKIKLGFLWLLALQSNVKLAELECNQGHWRVVEVRACSSVKKSPHEN